MTISYVEPVKTYVSSGNGNYPFTFKILAESDIEVWYTSASTGARVQLVRGSDFSVTIGNPGGTVTILGNAPAGGQILIQRRVPIDQPTDWVNNGPFDMDLLEADLDRIIMIVQQLGWDVSSGQAALNWRGPWVTTTAYTASDWVKTSDGNYYFCTVSHTAGTFSTDLAAGKWVLVLDFAAVQTQANNAAASAADALASKNTAIARSAAAELSEIAAAASEVAAAQSASNAAASAANILDWPVSTGLATDVAGLLAISRKNLLINGGFDVWQRGTSFSGNRSIADRWTVYADSSVSTQRVSISGSDVGPSGGTRGYYCRFDADWSITSLFLLDQKIENVVALASTTVTVSADVRGPANRTLTIAVSQHFGTGGTPSDTVSLTEDVNITTSWSRVSATFTLGGISGKTLGTDGVHTSYTRLIFQITESSAGSYLDIANVQLEFGDIATDFEYRHPGEELALCQRYYETGTTAIPKVVYMVLTSLARTDAVAYKVTKRVTPVLTIGALTASGHDGTPGALATTYTTLDEFCSQWTWTSGTAGRAFSAQFDWTADAEL